MAFLLAVSLQAQQQFTLLEEDFNSITSGVPDGWTETSDNYHMDWGYYSGTDSDGERCLDCFISTGSNTGDKLILKTPTLQFPSASSAQMMLTFDLKSTSEAETLSVYITKDGGITYDNTVVSNLTLPSVWTTYNYPLDTASTSNEQNVQIVFVVVSKKSGKRTMLDNVKIATVPSCQQPINISLNALTQTTAELTWVLTDIGNTPSAYDVIVTETSSNIEVINQIGVAVSGTTMPLTGLTANTSYSVSLKGNCTSEYKGHSKEEEFTFTTLCESSSLPFIADFENAINGEIPSCWITGGMNSTDVVYDATGGGIRLRSTKDGDSFVATQPISHPGNDLSISFSLSGMKNSKYMIGITSDITNASNIYPLYSDSLPSSGKKEFYLTTSNCPISSTNSHVVFYTPSGKDFSIYVDDVTITSIPACIRPQNLTASNISNTGVTLSWDSYGSQSASNYQIKLNEEIIDVNTNTHAVTGLTPNLQYSTQVRQICSVGDTSEWSLTYTFETYCDPITSYPILEGFEGSVFPPACWEKKQTRTGTGIGFDGEDNTWKESTSLTTVKTGNKSALLQDSKAGTRAILVSPYLTIPTAESHEVRFWLKRDASSYENEGVAIWVNNTIDTVGGVKLGKVSRSTQGTPFGGETGYQQFTFPLTMAGNVFVIFEGISEGGEATYIDDIEIRERPSCLSILDISLESVATNTVTFSWTIENGSATKWIVEHKASLDSEFTIDTVTSQSISISDLSPNTNYSYTIRVKSFCDPEVSEPIESTFNFHTNCFAIDLPYEEDFENLFANHRESCWSYPISEPTSTGYYEHASLGGVLRTSAHNVLVGPEINVDTWNGKRISIDATGENGPLIVGLMSDPTDVSTFVKLDSFPLWDDMKTYVLDINRDYSARHLALKNGNSPLPAKYNYYDNIKISVTPDCENVESVTASNITFDQVQINIEDTINNAWDIKYCALPYSEGNAVNISNISSNTHTLTGLTNTTKYALVVRSVCSSTEFGFWGDTLFFTTKSQPATVPYSCGFEDVQEINAWTILSTNGANQFTVGTATTAVKTGSNGLYISANGTTHNYNDTDPSTSWAKRTFQLETGVYTLKYYAKGMGEDDFDFMRVFMAPTGYNFTVVIPDKINVPKDVILADNGNDISFLYDWTEYNVTVIIPSSGEYDLAFGWKNDDSGGQQPPIAVEDISLLKVACEPVINISEISFSDSISLSWGNAAPRFLVKVDNKEFNPDSETGSIFNDTVSAQALNIGGLAANTYYYYYIKALCDDSESWWSDKRIIKTQCVPFGLPYSEDFDSEETSIDCWISLGLEAPTLNSSNIYSGSKSIEFDDGVTIVSPEFDVPSLVGYQLSTMAYSTQDTVRFAIGVISDVNDISTYEVVEEVMITQPEQWAEVITNFNILSDPEYSDWANAKNIVIVVSEDYNVWFDDITIEAIPSCPKARFLALSALTDTSVTVDWRSGGYENSWNVRLYYESRLYVDTTVTSHPVIFDNLMGNSDYSIELRAICSETEMSEQTSVSFTTICPVLTKLPFVENFNRFPDAYKIECWNNDKRTDNYEEWEVYVGDKTPTPAYEYEVFNYSSRYSGEYSIIETPRLDFRNLRGASMEFEYMNAKAQGFSILVSTDGGVNYTDTVFNSNAPVEALTLHSVDLSQYVGQLVNIAFRGEKISANTSRDDRYIRIDNIFVFEKTTCPTPMSSDVLEVTATSVKIAINDSASSTWEIAILPSSSLLNSATSFRQYSNDTVIIDNLMPGTVYIAYVRSVCDGGMASRIISTSEFTTECLPVENIPYVEGFELNGLIDLVCSDTLGTKTATTTLPFADLTTGASYINSGKKALLFNNHGEKYIYFVLPEMAAPLDTLALEFWYRNLATTASDAVLEVGIIPLDCDTTQFEVIYYCPKNDVKSKVELQLAHLGYKHGYRLAFRSKAKASNKYVGIDDIKIDYRPACVDPFAININNITGNSAEVTVVDAVNTKWQIAYGAIGTEFEDLTVVDLTGMHSLSNLESSTRYNIYARAICANGDTSAWTTKYSFHTECLEILIDSDNSYVKHFEAYNNGDIPTCWTVAQQNSFGYPKIVHTETDGSCLRLQDGANSIVLPKFSRSVHRLYMRLHVSCIGVATDWMGYPITDHGELYVGYTNNPNDKEATVNGFVTNLQLGIWNNVDYELIIFPDSAEYIVISTQDESDIIIDSVTVYAAPDCYPPSVYTTEISNISDTSAQLSYTGSPNHIKLEYKLLKNGSVVANEWTTANTINFTNLDPISEYGYIMRSECNSEGIADTTSWTDTAYFTTIAVPATVPYVNSFENEDENASWYFTGVSSSTNEWIIGSAVAAQGSKSLYISNDGVSNAYAKSLTKKWAYRTIHLERGVYDLDYLHKALGSSSYAYMNIYLVPMSVDMSTVTQDTEGIIEVASKIYNNDTWTAKNNRLIVEETANYNLAFYFYSGISYTIYNPPAAVDSIRITKIDCPAVIATDLLYVSSDSVNFAMNILNSSLEGVQIVAKEAQEIPTYTEVDSLGFITTSDTVGIGGLLDNTQYYIYSRIVCGANDTSVWSESLPVLTPCVPDTVSLDQPFVEDFESYNHLEYLGGCYSFDYSATSATSSYRWKVNETYTTYNRVPRSGTKSCYLYGGKKDKMMRRVYLEANAHYSFTVWARQNESNTNKVNIVLIVDDLNGTLDTIADQYITNGEYQRVTGAFTPSVSGIYSMIIASNMRLSLDYLTIDDISIKENTCEQANNCHITDITANSATINWESASTSTAINITADNYSYDTVVVNSNDSVNALFVDNLSSITAYTVTFVNQCSNDIDSDPIISSFSTLCGTMDIPYSEDFQSHPISTLPMCWDNSIGTSSNATKWSIQKEKDNTSNYTLRFNSAHNTDGNTNVAVSPEWSIPSVGDYLFSFRYKNPDGGTFSAFLSVNHGESYSDTLFYNVRDVKSWVDLSIDLDDYLGENVSLILSSKSNRGSNDAYHYIDDIRINCYGGSIEVYDTVCAFNAYTGYGFDIPASQTMNSGVMQFERMMYATGEGSCDTTVLLNLLVAEAYNTTINSQMCSGDVYNEGLFENLTEAGQYYQTYTSAQGCDSLVTLNLTFYKTEFDRDTVLCEGESFVFGDQTISNMGVYVDSLISSQGCDSIIRLTVELLPKYYEFSAISCEGEDYTWENETYTTSGRYTKSFTNAYGCDSIRILNLYVVPSLVTIDTTICQGQSVFFDGENRDTTGVYVHTLVNNNSCDSTTILNLMVIPRDTIYADDYVCEGQSYYGHGFSDVYITQDSVLYRLERSDDNCEFVTELNLRFSPTDVTYDTVMIGFGETYIFGGNTLVSSGDYDHTYFNEDGCDSIVYLNLTVATGLGTIEVQTLTLAPNPIERLAYAVIDRDWSSTEQDGMRMEVLDATGKVLYTTNVTDFPITVGNLTVSGIYYVRITTGMGDAFIGKLVVK